LCTIVHQIHKDHSPLIFLYFDESFRNVPVGVGEVSRDVEFDDTCYDDITLECRNKSVPLQIIYRFVPEQGKLFLPQCLKLTDNAKDEIEIRSMPLLLYDEMLPVL
jgi:hypothetical protein